MPSDVLGVRKHRRSRKILALITLALIAECEGDIAKEITERSTLASLLRRPGTKPKHREWEEEIDENNDERLAGLESQMSQGVTLSPPDSGQALQFTHWLAHANALEGQLLDCIVCPRSPLDTPFVIQALTGDRIPELSGDRIPELSENWEV